VIAVDGTFDVLAQGSVAQGRLEAEPVAIIPSASSGQALSEAKDLWAAGEG